MPWIKRVSNVFRQRRLNQEIEEELASHIEEAIEQGRPIDEARRALGNLLQHSERSRDIRMLPWLDSLASDIVFGWRQLNKRRATSAAAILSLALALGATMAVFRLVDAVLLRPLPVAEPERLSYLAINFVDREGRSDHSDEFDYPTFRRYRDLAKDSADLMVVGIAARQDALLLSSGEPEKINRQFVSGNLFRVFGLQPALGRLLSPYDDVTPGGAPVAVLSYDFWTRRFARDPSIVGKTFRIGNDRLEIVGVGPKGFIGTEPGELTDIFLPAMMNAQAINSPGWSWFRIWMRPKSGWAPDQVGQVLHAAFLPEQIEQNQRLLLLRAAVGASNLQRQYRPSLLILSLLVALVLLVACANVGNLLTAQAAARSREMALRVSIGASRWRLIQLILVESVLLAVAASVLGVLFAAWSAPLVVSMLRVPEDPVRLVLQTGWRELALGTALALIVTLLFGLAPALRASAVPPVGALKGGEDPRSRQRLMNALLTAQIAFCVLVQFLASLFVTTFQRLATRPLGFSAGHVLVMDASATGGQSLAAWMQVAGALRQTPGVENVSLAGWPLLSGNGWTLSVRVPGRSPEPRSPYFLDVSQDFFATMRIRILDGRDFRLTDSSGASGPGTSLPTVGIVNESFARTYFDGGNPVGRWVDVSRAKGPSTPLQIIGYVRDAAYRDLREPLRPTVYVAHGARTNSTFLVRTSGDPLALTPLLRHRIAEAGPGFRVGTIQPQSNFVRWHLLRERLLAALSAFFALVALVLAAIGLYGVLHHAVTVRQREIGIRMALGAQPAKVVQRVAGAAAGVVCLGFTLGSLAGVAAGRVVKALLYGVNGESLEALTVPALIMLAAAVIASLPPALRAARIDPAQTLRSE
jgi:putative ABC transport system permease protein